jgi:hypothetical protein
LHKQGIEMAEATLETVPLDPSWNEAVFDYLWRVMKALEHEGKVAEARDVAVLFSKAEARLVKRLDQAKKYESRSEGFTYSPLLRLRLGQGLTAAGAFNRAIPQLGEAFKLPETHIEAGVTLYEAYTKAGRTQDAVNLLKGYPEIKEAWEQRTKSGG